MSKQRHCEDNSHFISSNSFPKWMCNWFHLFIRAPGHCCMFHNGLYISFLSIMHYRLTLATFRPLGVLPDEGSIRCLPEFCWLPSPPPLSTVGRQLSHSFIPRFSSPSNSDTNGSQEIKPYWEIWIVYVCAAIGYKTCLIKSQKITFFGLKASVCTWAQDFCFYASA